jgi:hypothetical protein
MDGGRILESVRRRWQMEKAGVVGGDEIEVT